MVLAAVGHIPYEVVVGPAYMGLVVEERGSIREELANDSPAVEVVKRPCRVVVLWEVVVDWSGYEKTADDTCRLEVERSLEAESSSEKDADLGRLVGVGTFRIMWWAVGCRRRRAKNFHLTASLVQRQSCPGLS